MSRRRKSRLEVFIDGLFLGVGIPVAFLGALGVFYAFAIKSIGYGVLGLSGVVGGSSMIRVSRYNSRFDYSEGRFEGRKIEDVKYR